MRLGLGLVDRRMRKVVFDLWEAGFEGETRLHAKELHKPLKAGAEVSLSGLGFLAVCW